MEDYAEYTLEEAIDALTDNAERDNMANDSLKELLDNSLQHSNFQTL